MIGLSGYVYREAELSTQLRHLPRLYRILEAIRATLRESASITYTGGNRLALGGLLIIDDDFQTSRRINMLLAHNVFFTLHDDSDAAVDAMVAACHKYLKEHPGVAFFAAGKVAMDLSRPVNDRMFHVALHVVFSSREAHDAYQTAESHLKFIEENKAGWKQVRVFDSYVTG